jgi:hypothetical protein
MDLLDADLRAMISRCDQFSNATEMSIQTVTRQCVPAGHAFANTVKSKSPCCDIRKFPLVAKLPDIEEWMALKTEALGGTTTAP